MNRSENSQLRGPPIRCAAADPAPVKGGKVCGPTMASSLRRSPSETSSCSSQLSTPSSSAKSAPSPRPTSRRRKVRFARKTRILLVPALSDISDEVTKELWFDNAETSQMQIEITKIIRAMRTGREHILDGGGEEEHCCRGLEHFRNTDGIQNRQARKEHVWDAVLDEQDRQREGGLNDALEISKVAEEAAEPARKEALAFGISDAEFVQRLRKQDTDDCSPRHRSTECRSHFQLSRATGTRCLRKANENCLTVLEQVLDLSGKVEELSPPGRSADAHGAIMDHERSVRRRQRSNPSEARAGDQSDFRPATFHSSTTVTTVTYQRVGGGMNKKMMNLKSLVTKKKTNSYYAELR